MIADAAGRWFLFKVDLDTVFVLEKKGLPEHMVGLDVVEQPTAFGDLLRTLEDAGEARVSYANTIRIELCRTNLEIKKMVNQSNHSPEGEPPFDSPQAGCRGPGDGAE